MAKPIIQNPTIKGKAAREFAKLFLRNSRISNEKQERNRKDVEIYKSSVKD